MRILFYTYFFYPELSGISGTIRKMSQELAARGHEICIIAPDYSKKEFKQISEEKKEIDLGSNITIVRLASMKIPFMNNMRMIVSPSRTFMEVIGFNPDIIHTHTPVALELLYTAKILHKPIIGTNHTAIGDHTSNSSWLIKIIRKYYVWFYNQMDFVSTPSQFLLDDMKKDGFRMKAEVISNPVVLSRWQVSESKEELKRKFDLSQNVIIFSGRLASEKNIEPIIKAIPIIQKEIPDINLAIVGYGPEEKKLKSLVHELGLEGKVKFFGFVNDDDYPKLFKASDLYVIMSISETQGMGMIAAMASGLPVIAANEKALPEYVEKNGFLVDASNEHELALHAIEILKNKERKESFSQQSLELVKQIDIKKVIDIWEKIYLDLIEKEG